MSQKPTKTITSAYTVADADCGYILICDSSTAFTITMQSAAGRYNFTLDVLNIGVGVVTIESQTVAQSTHAHVANNGGAAWVVAIGGGGGAPNFTDLSDTPSSYSGQGGKFVAVNSAANALEFVSTPSSSSGSFDYGLIADATSTSEDYGGLT